jgi:hypothetical protein
MMDGFQLIVRDKRRDPTIDETFQVAQRGLKSEVEIEIMSMAGRPISPETPIKEVDE